MHSQFRALRNVFSMKISQLAVAATVSCIGFSLVDTVWAAYMEKVLGNVSLIGFFAAFLSVVALVTSIGTAPLLKNKGKSSLYAIALVGIAVGYAFFANDPPVVLFAVAATAVTILFTLRTNVVGMITKDISSERELVKNEGVVYATANMAWVLGPLLAGAVASLFGDNMVFLLASLLVTIGVWIFVRFEIRDDSFSRTRSSFWTGLKSFFADPQAMLTYFISGGVNFWWALIYLFVPLFMLSKGMDEFAIGVFLFANTVPLVIGEYVLPSLVKKLGFKLSFLIGFGALASVSVACFFLPEMIFILSALVIASFAAALIEPTTEAYFFKVTKEKSADYYGLYNTTSDFHQFIARTVTAWILLFLPINFIFAVFGIGMAVFFCLSFFVKESVRA